MIRGAERRWRGYDRGRRGERRRLSRGSSTVDRRVVFGRWRLTGVYLAQFSSRESKSRAESI